MPKPSSQPPSSLGSHTHIIAVALTIFVQICTCMQRMYLFSPQAWSWAFHPQLERMELHTWIKLQKRPIHNAKSERLHNVRLGSVESWTNTGKITYTKSFFALLFGTLNLNPSTYKILWTQVLSYSSSITSSLHGSLGFSSIPTALEHLGFAWWRKVSHLE